MAKRSSTATAVAQASQVANHCSSTPAERLPALLYIVHQQLLLWHTRLHFLHPPVVKRDEVIPVTVLPIIGSWMAPKRSPKKLVELEAKRAKEAYDSYISDKPIANTCFLSRICPHLQATDCTSLSVAKANLRTQGRGHGQIPQHCLSGSERL
jgi:hypothetical protein